MLDVPSRILLVICSAVIGFMVAGLAIQGVPQIDVAQAATIDPASITVTAAPASTPAGAPAPEPVAEPVPQSRPITIAFAGDVHGESPIAEFMADGGNPLAGMADILSAADIAVVNLETALGTLGSPADKDFTFQADAILAARLADSGVDVVSMANNHGLDYGRDAAEDTRQIARAAGLQTVGYGADSDEAYAPAIIDVGGQTIAILGLTRVLMSTAWEAGPTRPGMASAYDIDRAAAAVRDAATQADHVVVTIHWGQERHTCPDSNQIELARSLAAAGAQVIAGHHPHVLQGIQDIAGARVAWSLGNFVFYAQRASQRMSGVWTVTLGEDGVLADDWQDASINGTGSPQPVIRPVGDTADSSTVTGDGPGCGPPAR